MQNQDASSEPQTQRKRPVQGVSRDDSDDELGTEDIPWEWIFEHNVAARDVSEEGECKRRKLDGKSIIGARLGTFECRIGDIVLLKGDGSNEAWVAILCEFVEDDGEGDKAANFMWFSTEKEIRNRDKKRSDFHWNELYISPSWDVNSLASINGKARVMSLDKFLLRYPSGKIPRNSPEYGKTFIARSRLHVSAVPASLPCREGEFSLVYSHLEAAITEGTGNCIYISGTPGTGKTATVREVVSRLEDAVISDELDDFIFVEINGMKITDPHQSYTLLWEALKGQRASPTQALDLLEREFSNPSPRRTPCVVLMDELDQLVTKNQAVMYNFFNWPTLRHSRLIVLAVANTMDLPERTLSNKISSRLGLTRITFPGYTHDQLMKIIQSRLEGVPGNIVDPDAVQFASRKVAAVSGDARRALDICRRAVELAEADAPPDSSTPSKKAPGGDTADLARRGRVTIATIKKAINEATSNPIQQHLRGLPLTSKLLMAAMLLRFRRTGLVETTFGQTLDELQRVSAYAPRAPSGMAQILGSHAKGAGQGGAHQRHTGRPGYVHTAALDLVAAGLINLEAQRAERSSKLRLAIADDEVKMAFREDPELRALGIGI
ncbi:Origin recognition complex subunit 1 [Beauveria bassiana]|uniref:Origin recognition complex subunit 1 n=1 Tax=Beauveria bassiana TaxID=176275 RepID=A0A2N6NGU1_BEABA|nr:Origin recognition complex subunit 1 [Beauveria bassiana]